MWAEWMNNFDLTVTKEDIEKYEKMRKEKINDQCRKIFKRWSRYI